jgi:hypothetical protein
MEQVARLEAMLKRKEIIRRIVIAAITIVMIALGITFASLREASREVIVNDIYGVKWETVTYNEEYTPWIAICLSFGIVTSTLFICDLLLCRFETLPVNGNYLTVYRGAIESVVYVNGEEGGRLELFSFAPVVEVIMPDKVKVTVTFCRGPLVMAHVTFSDKHSSVDI